MAIALVSAGAHVASGTPSFGQSTTAGNFLIAWTTGVTSASGWVSVSYVSTGTPSASYNFWYKPNCGAGEAAPVFTSATATQLAEFSGVDKVSPLDQGAVQTTTASSPNAGALPSSDAFSGSLLIFFTVVNLSKVGTQTITPTLNNGATANIVFTQANISQTEQDVNGWAITTSNSVADTYSWAYSSMNVSSAYAGMVSFKPAVASSFYSRPAIYSQAIQRASRW